MTDLRPRGEAANTAVCKTAIRGCNSRRGLQCPGGGTVYTQHLKCCGQKPCGFESHPGHHVGNCKFEWFASLRSATNSYSILGVKTNSRFRKIWFEPMFFSGLFCGFCLAKRGDNFKFFFGGILLKLYELRFNT